MFTMLKLQRERMEVLAIEAIERRGRAQGVKTEGDRVKDVYHRDFHCISLKNKEIMSNRSMIKTNKV